MEKRDLTAIHLMYESSGLDLAKAFEKEGAKLRFRKLIGLDELSDEDVDDILAKKDGGSFLGYLQGVDHQPVYTVSWGALWHGASGCFEIYHFDGNYFATLDYCHEVAGPFSTALEAAEWQAQVFDMNYDEDAGTSGSIHYSTEISKAGEKLISNRLAKELFESLTGHSGIFGGFYWCEAQPGKLFKDPFHGASGKALQELHEAQKGGALDAISSSQLKLEKLTKKTRVVDYALGEDAKYFMSAFDSFLMKVPMEAKGKLARFSTDWVRICLPRRVGKKTLVTVIPIDNPMSLVDDLIPASK